MNKQFFNFFLVSAMLLSCWCIKAGAQNIQAETKLQQYTIKIGEQTKLFLSVHQPAKARVIFPKLADTITGKVQIVSAGKRDTSFDQTDVNHTYATVTQSYLITSFDQGTYTIPVFSFSTSGGVIKSNESVLKVETVKVDTTKGIYDIKQPITVPYNIFDWLRDNWPWVVIPLAVLLLIAGLIYYLKTRPKKEVVVHEVKPEVPEHTVALNQLAELRNKKLWQNGEVKAYYIELSDILRQYLEKRYKVKTYEKTTDEIFEGLRYSNITADNKDTLRQLLLLSDLVKFAKEKPLPAENENSIEGAIRFVSNTKRAEIPLNTKEGGADV